MSTAAKETAAAEATQLICETPGECICTGDNACDCTPDGRVCSECGAGMVLINIDTGETVEEAVG